jgi:hypothetical protein
MFQHNPSPGAKQMVLQVHELLPGLPPLSIITVIGMAIVASSLLLYLLSRVPELLLVTAISFLYAAVPMLSILKHL